MATNQTKTFSLTEMVKKDKEALEKLDLLNNEDKKRIGHIIIKQMRERTRAGVGVTENGREYRLQNKAYSPEYAKKKGSSRVDLTLSGDMLDNTFVSETGFKSVTTSVRDEDYGKLRGAQEGVVRNLRSGGKRIKGTKTLIKRPWFGLSKKDVKTITSSEEFKRIFKRATNRFFNKRSKK